MTDRNSTLSAPLTWLMILLGTLVALAGLGLTIGGVMLIARDGSWYYVLMGLALLISGVLIARGEPAGAAVYVVAFVATVVWAYWEVGLEFWPLHARIFTFLCAFVVIMALHPLTLKRDGRMPMTLPFLGIAGVGLLAVIGFGWGMFQPHGVRNATVELAQPSADADQAQDWPEYGGTPDQNRFAAINQITPENVNQLEVAWTFQTGDIPDSTGGGAEDQSTPLQVGEDLFLCTPHNTVISLNATSGEENWRHDFPTETTVWVRCRGLAYFDIDAPLPEPDTADASDVTPVQLPEDAACRRRIIMNTIDALLVALDADTGELCTDFGDNGTVNLKLGLGNSESPLYEVTSPPVMAGTTVVVGGRVADNVALDMPGGVVRGFDVITGEMRWAFDPGDPDDRQAPTGDDVYTRSTPNVWAPMTYDASSNTVFLPVGSAAIDLWGVERTPEDEEYGATLLALDATTGDERWKYQTVHHDLWDFDVPMQPTLIDFDGTPALVFGTKAGQIFVLDRATGEPLTEVEEREVLPANIPDENYAETQPFSVGMPQIGVGPLTEADMWGATPFDQLMCRYIFKGYRYEGLFTAPDVDYSLSYPGSLGGMNWGGLSHDPNSNTLFVNDMRLGLWVHMEPQEAEAQAGDGNESVNAGMGAVPLQGTPYSVIKDRFLSPLGIPCQKPPFGSLTAINMDDQTVAWEVPLGTVQDTVLYGVKMGLPMPVGMPTIGGSLATEGGLVFFAATQDYWLRAFDMRTGEEVWKARLPVGSQGTPMSYVSPEDGRQYIVISAGGARQSPDRGDYVVAYALPDS
ncbi:MAG: membrane-bound PQQ-dependent dehydrogenase, glucose/quinate/shikimate family [Paracoccus denitrificans]|uniref:Membrane-bound PQQ-dependent dehydrogenase, glucose/quinate/shikimate family n=1 Tax=Paracoccus denitrificans TaxID=266 RepID=A0A533I452_PARDE|nr:MAG: membrane-bound PQQ-dependent dehydrogenase, glucose/quinate/shikimate family [Paracoccus denitrificans]